MVDDNSNEEIWRKGMEEGDPGRRLIRRVYHRLPSDPRCNLCFAPFRGPGGAVFGTLMDRRPSIYNPRICNFCDKAVKAHPGGVEVGLTLLFADVRGSSRLAEGMSPTMFSRLMDRFYTSATHAVAEADGLIEKFVGDEVTALFLPGLAGAEHAKKALQAAQALLRATGHDALEGPWLPVGAGIHTGVAFVGSIGSGGVQQLAALGDVPNTAAHLATSAAAGEILVSAAAAEAAGLDMSGLEQRELQLKGLTQPVRVHVLRARATMPAPV